MPSSFPLFSAILTFQQNFCKIASLMNLQIKVTCNGTIFRVMSGYESNYMRVMN